jgi:hypothetical protein
MSNIIVLQNGSKINNINTHSNENKILYDLNNDEEESEKNSDKGFQKQFKKEYNSDNEIVTKNISQKTEITTFKPEFTEELTQRLPRTRQMKKTNSKTKKVCYSTQKPILRRRIDDDKEDKSGTNTKIIGSMDSESIIDRIRVIDETEDDISFSYNEASKE